MIKKNPIFHFLTYALLLFSTACFGIKAYSETIEYKEAFFKKALGLVGTDQEIYCLGFIVDFETVALPSTCLSENNPHKPLYFKNEIGRFLLEKKASNKEDNPLVFYNLLQENENSPSIYFNSWFLQLDIFDSQKDSINVVSLNENGEIFLKNFTSFENLLKDRESLLFLKHSPHFYLIKNNKVVGWQKETITDKNKNLKLLLLSEENKNFVKQSPHRFTEDSYSVDMDFRICVDRNGNKVSCDGPPIEKPVFETSKNETSSRTETLGHRTSTEGIRTQELTKAEKAKILEITANYLKSTQRPIPPTLLNTNNLKQYAYRIEVYVKSQLKDQYYSDRMLFIIAAKEWAELSAFFENSALFLVSSQFKEQAVIFLKNASLTAVQFVPVLSTCLDVKSLITGYDTLTGEKLSNVEKTILVSTIVPSIFITPLRGTVKVINDLVTSGSHTKIPLSNDVLEKINDLAEVAGFDLTKLASGPAKVNQVILETISQTGDFTSKVVLTADEFLDTGIKWLGDGYKNLGLPNSGVYESLDGKRKFRMDKGSITGRHDPYEPHGHLEVIVNGENIHNNHILIRD